jgi:cytochrome c oxidase cbb3-type subunit III
MNLLALFVLAAQAASPAEAEGQKLFNGQCAVCHGIGGGGGTGPSLKKPQLPRAPDDEALVKVITQGIPNTQMPGAWHMTGREAAAVAAYIRSIGKVANETPISGDPGRGLAVYRKQGCAGCHIIAGAGNAFGPELTGLGLRRGAEHLRQSIVDPAAEVDGEYMTVKIGRSRMRRVNEDSFTIQVMDTAGKFHSYAKKDLASFEKLPKESLMPAYSKLSPGDLDDLVAYLAGLR